jgi:hypothetical protein
MTSNWQESDEVTYSGDNLSSNTVQLSNSLTTIDSNIASQDIHDHDLELGQQILIEEVADKYLFFFLLQ